MLQNNSNTRPTTQARHRRIKERFDALYAQKVEGISLDLEGIILKLASEFCYSPRTVGKILKGR